MTLWMLIFLQVLAVVMHNTVDDEQSCVAFAVTCSHIPVRCFDATMLYVLFRIVDDRVDDAASSSRAPGPVPVSPLTTLTES